MIARQEDAKFQAQDPDGAALVLVTALMAQLRIAGLADLDQTGDRLSVLNTGDVTPLHVQDANEGLPVVNGEERECALPRHSGLAVFEARESGVTRLERASRRYLIAVNHESRPVPVFSHSASDPKRTEHQETRN